MTWHITFDPLIAVPLLIGAGVLVLLLAGVFLASRVRGSLLRTTALALGVLALANPVITEEEREPLTSVAALVVDRSDSQSIGERKEQADAAFETLKNRLSTIPNLETRIIETDGRDKTVEGTALFSELEKELADVPPDRIAGALIISDGQVHDVPQAPENLGFNAPVHGLITGETDEFDLELMLTEAPRFGIVGEEKNIKFRIESTDSNRVGSARVAFRLNGETLTTETVPIGVEITFGITLDRGGKNIFEIDVAEVDGELTTQNNTAIQTIEGIRENLRVLLVSGEPHAGERTWRNLLKSDASVDLVHFTILRPPEKQDGTPINQLSLIAFPTRELFSLKINEFDLIIFDRYKRRGVLPILYFDNIARYVQEGGAVLVASGPEYSESLSIFQTPLAPVLPGLPQGTVFEEPYHATLSEEGRRHPVTRNLEGSSSTPPDWSRWFRLVDVAEPKGNVVMEGPNERPLLILNREEEGRVALMLSDHAWLWARGFEGGGPHVQLLRRLSHWLMKEPDLEEEALRGFAEGDDLVFERQTMQAPSSEAEAPGNSLSVVQPSGERIDVPLTEQEDGFLTARIKNAAPGLYEVSDGEIKTLAHMGPPNPKEFQDVISTPGKLQTIADATGGRTMRVNDRIPNVVPINGGQRSARSYGGREWLGLKMTDASVLLSVNRIPLFAGLLGLALLLTALSTMWYREGR